MSPPYSRLRSIPGSHCQDRQGASWFRASREARAPEWCSECNEDHPAVFFTRQQRLGDRSTRTCIGRQGNVRICSHASLSWSDIEKVSWKKLRLDCGRKDNDGHPVLLEVETVGVNDGKRSIQITIHTSSWDTFRQTSFIPGTPQLPSAKKILESITKSKEDGASTGLCPHASFNPAKWQMNLQPQSSRESCDLRPGTETVLNEFFSTRANATESPFEQLCPLCEITTTNEAPAIKSRCLWARHHDSCSQCNARYDWTWSSTRSFGYNSDSLKLKTTRQFTVTKPTDAQWLRNLEITPGGPADPRGDPTTRHLLWCEREPGTFVDWNTVSQWKSP